LGRVTVSAVRDISKNRGAFVRQSKSNIRLGVCDTEHNYLKHDELLTGDAASHRTRLEASATLV
jgi:hypothetical protein